MNRDPILFRVDGTTRAGWEGLARCQALAAALQRRRRPTYFLSQLEPLSLAFGVKRAATDWLEADEPAGSPEDLAETIQEVRRLQPAAVVIDSPDVSEEYVEALRATGTLIVAVDHLANRPLPARLLINPLLAPGKEAYSFAPGAQLLAGSRFAIVRPEVRRARPTRSQEPPLPFRALVAVGEDDPHGQSLELTRQLLAMSRVPHIDVMVRPHHPDLELLKALAEQNPERVEIATEPAEVTARLSRCHFAITGGSSWALELACVGVPQLLIVQSEGHWPTAQRLEEEGAATCLGWHENVSPQTIRQAVQNMLSEPLDRQAMSRCGRLLIDARGLDRLVTALEIMLHPSRQVAVGALAA
jgi:spore coat polysaccharide biosynthesis predicted glycosyltransferase SpsG